MTNCEICGRRTNCGAALCYKCNPQRKQKQSEAFKRYYESEKGKEKYQLYGQKRREEREIKKAIAALPIRVAG